MQSPRNSAAPASTHVLLYFAVLSSSATVAELAEYAWIHAKASCDLTLGQSRPMYLSLCFGV